MLASAEIFLQVLIFLRPHDRLILFGFILIVAQVQGAMKDYPVQFMLKGNIQIKGIFPDAIDADVYFTGNHPALRRRKGKGQNIGKIVMIQETSVQIQKIIVVTENIREIS